MCKGVESVCGIGLDEVPVIPATLVIPAKAGIQTKDEPPVPLDPRLREGGGKSELVSELWVL